MDILITLVILLFSAIVHEVSHGLMAERLGDDTAREQGRITLNPIPHIDPFGSILLPAFLLFVGSPVILGSAKPVPVNFNNLRDPRRGMVLVSLAGPLSNLFLAVVLALPFVFGFGDVVSSGILLKAIGLNFMLFLFNLIPIPPLDGSKVIAAFLPNNVMNRFLDWERYGFVLVFAFLYLGVFTHIFVPALVIFCQIVGIDARELFQAF